MRFLTLCALVAALIVGAALPASATGTIVGKIQSTYLAAGGAATLGDPIGVETKISAYGRNTYHQHTTKGTVYWDGSQGGKTWLHGAVPSLSGVDSERDALGRYGYTPGMLWRSAKLCGATTAAKRLVTAMLHDVDGNKGTILDLRTSGTCSEPSFPSTVTKVRVSIPSHADYSRYVTGSTERLAFGRALTAIANAPGSVLVHCTKGKDRTGWTVALVMYALGSETGDVLEEFLRTDDADEADLVEALDTVAERYGVDGNTGIDEYLRAILNEADPGSADATLAKLRVKFGA